MAFTRWGHIAAAVLFGLAWLLPGHFRPWVSFQQESLAAVGALFLAYGNRRGQAAAAHDASL